MPPCLIGMKACVGAHHLSRKLKMFGHDVRLKKKGDSEAIVEAVQRPTMKFVANKDRRSARPTVAAPGARAISQPTHWYH
jgi:transposase